MSSSTIWSGRCSTACRCSWAGSRSKPQRPSPGGDRDPLEVDDAVARLVDKSMVDVDRRLPGRYRLLETLRQYGFDRLVDAGVAEEILARHAAHYSEFGAVAEVVAEVVAAGLVRSCAGLYAIRVVAD